MSKKYLFLYLSALFVVNLTQSVFLELSYDEAYYWMYSKFLSFGYYDHPPMVAWMIKAGSIFGHSEFSVRFFFNLFSVGSLYYLWKMSDQKNIKSFIAITLSLPLIQAAGFLALPDTGLLFFSTLFLYFVKDYALNVNIKNTLGLAIVIPLLFYSKYHGLAVVLFTTLANLNFLKRKSFWLIVLITIILYLPHMYWQYSHDFITFRFHLFGRGEKIFEFKNIMNYISSQIVLFGLTNFLILIYLTKKINLKNSWERTLFVNVFGFLILLLFVSFRNQIEANWTVSACMASVPLFLILLEKNIRTNKLVKISSVFPFFLIIGLRILFVLPSSFYDGKKIDRLNEVKGWKKRIEEIKSIVGNKPLISDTYQIAAKLSFYLKRHIPALHITSRDSHYNLLKSEISNININEEIYFLSPKLKEDSIRIETGYKDPIYLHKTTLNKLLKRYNLTEDFLTKSKFELDEN